MSRRADTKKSRDLPLNMLPPIAMPGIFRSTKVAFALSKLALIDSYIHGNHWT